MPDLEPLTLVGRGRRIARGLYECLPRDYSEALSIILESMTAIRTDADEFGLAEFFYLPHGYFIAVWTGAF